MSDVRNRLWACLLLLCDVLLSFATNAMPSAESRERKRPNKKGVFQLGSVVPSTYPDMCGLQRKAKKNVILKWGTGTPYYANLK